MRHSLHFAQIYDIGFLSTNDLHVRVERGERGEKVEKVEKVE